MQGVYNTPYEILLISQLPQLGLEGSFFFPGSDSLLSFLYGNKQTIEKLLENQSFLKNYFQAPTRT